VDDLKKMWEPAAQGKVAKWKDVNPAWPDAPMKLFGAGADSGTFDYFTEAIVGKSKSSRGDFTAAEDDNVLVQGVSRDVNALGFFGYAYYHANADRLKAVAIAPKQGAAAVLPSMETVLAGTYSPLSRPIFIYVSTKALERPEVAAFVDYYLRNASRLSREVQYVPLPEPAYVAALEHVKQRRAGTVFGGEAEVGVTIDELIRRDARL